MQINGFTLELALDTFEGNNVRMPKMMLPATQTSCLKYIVIQIYDSTQELVCDTNGNIRCSYAKNDAASNTNQLFKIGLGNLLHHLCFQEPASPVQSRVAPLLVCLLFGSTFYFSDHFQNTYKNPLLLCFAFTHTFSLPCFLAFVLLLCYT